MILTSSRGFAEWSEVFGYVPSFSSVNPKQGVKA